MFALNFLWIYHWFRTDQVLLTLCVRTSENKKKTQRVRRYNVTWCLLDELADDEDEDNKTMAAGEVVPCHVTVPSRVDSLTFQQQLQDVPYSAEFHTIFTFSRQDHNLSQILPAPDPNILWLPKQYSHSKIFLACTKFPPSRDQNFSKHPEVTREVKVILHPYKETTEGR